MTAMRRSNGRRRNGEGRTTDLLCVGAHSCVCTQTDRLALVAVRFRISTYILKEGCQSDRHS